MHAKGSASACLHRIKFAFVRFCLQPGVHKAQSQICAAGIPTSFDPSPALASPALLAWSCLPCEWPHKAPTLNSYPTRFPVPAAATSWGVLAFLQQSQLSFLGGGKNIQSSQEEAFQTWVCMYIGETGPEPGFRCRQGGRKAGFLLSLSQPTFQRSEH